ncbi:MAG TPA: methylmalonyl Co-A mutase-associated GTPase MeaB [Chloroflexota bacterium]|nr:methylmalonyl Co-A mutase-associated GTPase MeaB [Chloroflexota bacterium]
MDSASGGTVGAPDEARGTDPADSRTVELAARVEKGDRRAVARALSVVERADTSSRALIALLFPRTGRAHLVGVTGVGGVGKSSLIARLVTEWRRRGKRVGVVAVDPTSAATGGALLGDRIRMEELLADPGVFVRSMATRGAGGGLARATIDATRVFDAAGYDVVVVETIGVGQDQLDVGQVAETIVVVEAPNLGDDVQALKAGLREIADVYAVNKADTGSTDRTVATLRAMLALEGDRDWNPPIVKTSAATGEGIAELADAAEVHLAWLARSRRRAARRRERARAELRRLLQEQLLRDLLGRVGDPDLTAATTAVLGGTDPYRCASELLRRYHG